MPVKKIRGIQMAYDDEGAGPVLVFIHGHPFNRTMWKEQVAHFKKEYRLIIPDLRGYGETSVSSTRVMLDEMVLDILYLLDELAIEKAVFCGLSMGGQIVLDAYRLFPGKVRAMIIVCSDARGETPESYHKRLILAETISRDGMKKYTDENIQHYLSGESMKDVSVYRHLYGMMTGTSAEGAAAANRGRAERRDHIPVLASVAVPVMVIAGSEDYFTPLPVAEMMSNRIPGARLECIGGSGHLPNMEAPEEFNKLLTSFMNQINS
ncbi:alpha/beta fold hydrolase [Flavitalea flava]